MKTSTLFRRRPIAGGQFTPSFWITAFSILCLLLWGLGIREAQAQVDTSLINGTISDATGSAIPGANVTIANIASQVAVELRSDDSGRYSSPPLKPGRYKVSARRTASMKAR